MPNLRDQNGETRLDRRLEDLDAELRNIRKSVRTIERQTATLRKQGAMPPAPSADRMSRPAADPPTHGSGPADGVAPPDAPLTRRPAEADLFTRPAGDGGGGAPANASEDKRKFAHYFSSTSFLGARPLREQRRMQRNRAIFMIIVVAAAAFVIFSIVKR